MSNVDKFFYFNFSINNKQYKNLQTDLNEFYKSNQYEEFNKFKSRVNKFIKINNISLADNEYLEILSKIFIDFVLVFYKNLYDSDNISSTFHNFTISSIRIFEFVLFISNTNNDSLIKRLLLDYSFEENYYIFLQNADLSFVDIKLAQKHKRNVIEINVDSKYFFYFSSLNIQQFQKEFNNFFRHFLKLDDENIKKFYFIKQELKKSVDFYKEHTRNGSRVAFEVLDTDIEEKYITNKILYKKNIEPITKEIAIETKKEINFSKKMIFPTLDEELREKLSIPKKDIESKFKRMQIARAISNQILKQNLKLSNSFNTPDKDLLQNFISFIKENNDQVYIFFIIPVIFGISISDFISGIQNDFIKLQDNKLTIKYAKKIFSKISDKEKISHSIADSFYIYLDSDVKELIQKFIDTKHLFNDEEFKKELKVLQNQFNKKIVLPSNLAILFEIYSKNFFNYSIDLLFRKNVTKNEEAQLCYCAVTERLFNYEIMVNNIANLLGLISRNGLNEYSLPKEFKYIGSNFYIKSYFFNKFLRNLNFISSFLENDIDRLNIRMIYIRYSLGLLLGTRDFFNSCNLSNYSKTLNVLMLKEKAKNLFSSVRIIPLISESIKFIDEFYELKKKFNIKSNSPVLLKNNKEIEINIANMKDFIINLNIEDKKIKEELLIFISIVKLNFGRHILTTFFNSQNVKKEFIDAFLNHFQNGTEDQGIYTNLDNKEYIRSIQDVLKLLYNKFFKGLK